MYIKEETTSNYLFYLLAFLNEWYFAVHKHSNFSLPLAIFLLYENE